MHGGIIRPGCSGGSLHGAYIMDRPDREDAFLDALYQAAIEPARWDDAVAAYMVLFDANIGHSFIYEWPFGAQRKAGIRGLSDEHLRLGEQYYHARDPWVPAAETYLKQRPQIVRRGFVMRGSETLPYGRYSETEYFRDYGRLVDVHDHLTISVNVQQNWSVTLTVNTPGGRQFTDAEKATAERLAPHVARAFDMQRRFGLKHGAGLAGDLLDESALAVLLVQGGKLQYANPGAQKVLDRPGPVSLRNELVKVRDARVQAALDGMQNGTVKARLLSFLVQEGPDHWLVQLARRTFPQSSILHRARLDDALVLVALTPMSLAAAARRASVDSLTWLSPQQRQVLRRIGEGFSIAEIAAQLGVEDSTVRTHLKALFAATGLHSQADLARMAALLLPIKGEPAPPKPRG